MPSTERTPNGTAAVALAARTNTVVTAPSGAVNGVDVVAVAFTSGAAALASVTAPAGWELIGRANYSEADPYTVEVSLFVKAYAGEASWTFTHTASSSQAFAKAWTGANLVTIQDTVGSTVQSNGVADLVIPSITTTTDEALIIVARGSWDGTAITPPAGFTERQDVPVLWVGDLQQATAGATGTVTISSGNAGSTLGAGAVMGALRSVPPPVQAEGSKYASAMRAMTGGRF